MAKHYKFMSRTVLVLQKTKEPEQTFSLLNSVLRREGHLTEIKRNRYFEKPCVKRRRLAFEESIRVYKKDLGRKVEFIRRKEDRSPWRIG